MKHLISLGFIIAFISLIFPPSAVIAQRTCGTMDYLQQQQTADPQLKHRMDLIEARVQQWIQNQQGLKKTGHLITIPVVVHVVYNNPTENISDAQILSQIDVLNEDFRRLNADVVNTPSWFTGVAADCQIEFCLAQRDPFGNPTTGITRTPTGHGPFTTNDDVKFDATGGKDAWDRDCVLNIWVCDLSGSLLGYATFPGGPAALDGVVIDYQYFGTVGTATAPFNLGRTTTHEVGHWLALYHTFNGGCVGTTSATCATQGDLVCDTPPTSAPNYFCPGTQNTCTETPVDENDMTMNYMDYVDDACMNLFTEGQKTRMWAALNGPRLPIQSSPCCDPIVPPLPPIADFMGNPTSICPGDSVNFTDLSTQSPDSWFWDFGDGFTDITQNPTHQYNAPGTYNVTLIASNSMGSDTITINAYITVNPNPFLTIAGSDVSCNGVCDGDATVSASGSAPYIYLWDDPTAQTTPTATGLCTGIFSVIVTDANGCSAIIGIIINELSNLNVFISSNNISCNGVNDGSASAVATGGILPYTYLWNNSATTASISSLTAGTYDVTVTDANGCIAADTVTITEPSPLTASTTGNNASCNGTCDGDATVTPAGGVGPYTYQWNDPLFQDSSTATSLCAGTYSITVTDTNGCTTTGNIIITESDTIALSTSSVDATCGNSDGSVSVSVTGGTSPYTYSWNDPLNQTTATATGLVAGGYTVTIADANGCIAIATVSVNDVGGPSATIVSIIDVDCNSACDGETTVSVTGGTTPYTYLWNDPLNQTIPTAIDLCAGTYSVAVTDANGCVAVVSVNITEPLALNTSITGGNNASCNGVCDGGAIATVSGGTGSYTYLWNDISSQTTATATGLCAGTYSVSVTDSVGCVAVDIVIISEPLVLTANITGSIAVCSCPCAGSAYLFPVGGTPPYTIIWSNSYTDQFQTGLCDGVYTITLTDANGCTATGSVTLP